VTIVGTDAAGADQSRVFTVSGVLQTGGVEEGFIFMSMADMGGGGDADVVECSIAAGEAELRSFADRVAGEVSSITPRLVKRVTQSEGAVLGKLQALVYLVTAVVLLLTLICVSTTMTAVVAERRKEIGLKKALGASNGSIVLEFMGEGLFLGGFGGLLGVVLGFLFAQAVSVNVYGRLSAFPYWLAPVTIAVSIAMTGLACLLPVRSATEVEPATVLRGE
jgi:putative ABC transport system permease protein